MVNEILEHEACGLGVHIFSLRPPADTHFQDLIAKVRAPVTYVPSEGIRAADLWDAIQRAAKEFPDFCGVLEQAKTATAVHIFQAAEMSLAAKENGIRHFHAHFASVATTVTRLASLMSGIPFTFTAHAKDIFHETVDKREMKDKLMSAASVVTVSEFNLKFLRDAYGDAANKVQHIYNGLDLSRFSYASPESRPPKIISVGRLVEKKGLPDLIDACAILRERGLDFLCEIIGEGEMRPELEDSIARLGLGGQVCILGPRPQAEVVDAVRSAAVLAAPCVVGKDGNRDGLPTVLLEAMALGTPCVSTDVTGIPEVVIDGETGLITPQNDPSALAEALQRLIGDPCLRTRLAANARRLIEGRFDIRVSAERLRSLFGIEAREGAVPWPA